MISAEGNFRAYDIVFRPTQFSTSCYSIFSLKTLSVFIIFDLKKMSILFGRFPAAGGRWAVAWGVGQTVTGSGNAPRFYLSHCFLSTSFSVSILGYCFLSSSKRFNALWRSFPLYSSESTATGRAFSASMILTTVIS